MRSAYPDRRVSTFNCSETALSRVCSGLQQQLVLSNETPPDSSNFWRLLHLALSRRSAGTDSLRTGKATIPWSKNCKRGAAVVRFTVHRARSFLIGRLSLASAPSSANMCHPDRSQKDLNSPSTFTSSTESHIRGSHLFEPDLIVPNTRGHAVW